MEERHVGDGREGRTCDIVHALVDYNVHSLLGCLVRCYVGCGEGFRHCERFEMRSRVLVPVSISLGYSRGFRCADCSTGMEV